MSNNPYAHPGDFGQQEPIVPERTAGLAIASVVISVFGLIVCCIPGVGLFVGLVGALLGILALFTIRGARGRVGGRGLAFTGIALGTVAMLLNVAVLVGASQGWAWIAAGPTHKLLSAVDRGDYAAARTVLSPGAASAATDAELDRFAREVRDKVGGYVSTPHGPVQAFRAAGGGVLKETMAVAQRRRLSDFIPVPVEYDKAWVGALMVLDPSGGSGTLAGSTANVGIVTQDGQEVWLLDPGGPPGAPPPAPQVPRAPPTDPTEPPQRPEPPQTEEPPEGGEGAGAAGPPGSP